MLATDMTSSGSSEEKLRWAFKMYDEDGSGFNLSTKIFTFNCHTLSVTCNSDDTISNKTN